VIAPSISTEGMIVAEVSMSSSEGVEGRVRDMGLSPISHRIDQKPYPGIFDSIAYPVGWRILDFSKFDGDGSRTTWEHVSQYLAQLEEVGSVEALRI
jgi:hypothetical protein